MIDEHHPDEPGTILMTLPPAYGSKKKKKIDDAEIINRMREKTLVRKWTGNRTKVPLSMT